MPVFSMQQNDISYSQGTQPVYSCQYWWFYLYAALIVAAIISRRPDALLHAQLWAEDGIWLANDYNLGIAHALLLPWGGYFQTFPRLAAGLALVFPLSYAPLAMNAIALLVQSLPPVFLLTRRFSYVGNIHIRFLMGFLLVGIPTAPEVYATVTHSMEFLGLLTLLVFVAKPPDTTAWRVFDVGVIVLSGATGVFVVFVFPLAALLYWVRRQPWTRVLLVIQGCFALVQGITIFLIAGASRSRAPLGATPLLLVRIVGSQVLLYPLMGFGFFSKHPLAGTTLCMIAFLAAVLLLVYVFCKGPLELRLLMLFGTVLLAAALRTPLVSLVHPQWPYMVMPATGGRYWLIPGVSFLWAYVWMLGRARPTIIRILSALIVTAALCTSLGHWQYQPLANLDFPKYAREFQQVPPGQQFVIPINPPGGWTVVLIKH